MGEEAQQGADNSGGVRHGVMAAGVQEGFPNQPQFNEILRGKLFLAFDMGYYFRAVRGEPPREHAEEAIDDASE